MGNLIETIIDVEKVQQNLAEVERIISNSKATKLRILELLIELSAASEAGLYGSVNSLTKDADAIIEWLNK